MNKINMGVIQARSNKMDKKLLIEFAKTLKLDDEGKQRLWSHWQLNKKIEGTKDERIWNRKIRL